MSNPFSDLAQQMANVTGFDVVICGFILGIVLTFVILVIFIWILDPKGNDASGFSMYAGLAVSLIINTIIGWFPVWVPLVTVVIVAWLLLDPMGTRGRGNPGSGAGH